MKYQFVDCRWELGKPDRGRDLNLGGHIPGASFLDVDSDLSSPAGARGRHPLPDPEEFARAAGRAGIGDGVFVVAYGNMGGAGELERRRRELVVVDARLAPRWRGEPNPIDKVPGRIPGAVNAPWNETPPELPDGELVAYCGSGVTASVLLHRLHLAGREGKLYPGSWSEWEQLGLPVERS